MGKSRGPDHGPELLRELSGTWHSPKHLPLVADSPGMPQCPHEPRDCTGEATGEGAALCLRCHALQRAAARAVLLCGAEAQRALCGA